MIAFKTDEGRIKLRQTKDMTTGKGARRGGFWGLVVGLILGGPLFGVLAGLGLGAIAGRRIDHGLDDEFISKVSRSLKPSTSALLVLIDEVHGEGHRLSPVVRCRDARGRYQQGGRGGDRRGSWRRGHRPGCGSRVRRRIGSSNPGATCLFD